MFVNMEDNVEQEKKAKNTSILKGYDELKVIHGRKWNVGRKKSRNCFNFILACKYGRGGLGRGRCAFQRFTLYITALKKDKTPTEVFPF